MDARFLNPDVPARGALSSMSSGTDFLDRKRKKREKKKRER
jgi:hypothetical protein